MTKKQTAACNRARKIRKAMNDLANARARSRIDCKTGSIVNPHKKK